MNNAAQMRCVDRIGDLHEHSQQLSRVAWYVGRRVLFVGHDSYYHMRRIFHALLRFPESLDFDLYINFPHGARAIWPPHFDWAIAALLRPFAERLTPRAVELLASLVPPLVGAGTVVALYFLARRHFGLGVAMIAAVVLAVLPAHFAYSQFSYVDHHCAVALATTLLLFAAMSLADALGDAESGAGRRWRCAIATGLSCALALLVWPGALLHVAIVEVGLLVLVLTRADRGPAIAAARLFFALNTLALAILAPFSIGQRWAQWSDFSPVVLSNFQPWFFAVNALGAALCMVAWWRWRALAASRARRGLGALAIAVAVGASSLLAWPGLAAGAVEAIGWLAKAEEFQRAVVESKPLFWTTGHFSLMPALSYLSAFVVLVPLALVAGVAEALRRTGAAALWLFLAWTAVLFAVTCLQARFFNSFSVALALLLALSLRALYRIAIERLGAGCPRRGRRQRTRAAVATALGVALLALLAPAWSLYAPLFSTLGGGGSRTLLKGEVFERFASSETAQWIRENTPPTSGWLDPTRAPEYAVLASWDLGHLIEYVARRPTPVDNFGDDLGGENFARVQEYFRAAEPRAVEILERLGARYVVVPYYDEFLGREVGPASMYRALWERDGSASAQGVPALERHRLVYEFATRKGPDPGRALFKVFQHVAGARIRGRASPGSEVRARLPLVSPAGRHFEYASRTRADAEGRYELRVPYASAEPYRLRCGRDEGVLRVTEAAVLQGRKLTGPELCRD